MKTPAYLKNRTNYIFSRRYAKSVRTGKTPLNPALLGAMLEVAEELQEYLIKIDALARQIGEPDSAVLESLRPTTTFVPPGDVLSKKCFYMKDPCVAVLKLPKTRKTVK